MFGLFNRKKKSEAEVYAAYSAIVAQARREIFYTAYAVPDTTEGRFENIVLHIFLFLHRLKGESEETRRFGQEVFDLFFADMDRSLREAGVGDLTVPKRIKAMAEAFYGRVKKYDEALADGAESGALEAAIGRFLYSEPPSAEILTRFAAYVRAATQQLAQEPVDRILGGAFAFPAPQEASHG